MALLVASEFLSADGFMSGPNNDMGWVFKLFNEQMGKYAAGLMESMDAVVLGRTTYEIMAGAWPGQTEATSPGADKMNGTPKFVVSRTLKKADWGTYNNATVMGDELGQGIARLKRQFARNLVIYGSGRLVRALTELGLIDEYQLLVHPVLLGSGQPLFSGLNRMTELKLVRSEAFGNGVMVLYYQPTSAS